MTNLDTHDIDSYNNNTELKPRVFDSQGNAIAWWSDHLQSVLENHPKIREIAEKQEPLGDDFETVLNKNRWKLYES